VIVTRAHSSARELIRRERDTEPMHSPPTQLWPVHEADDPRIKEHWTVLNLKRTCSVTYARHEPHVRDVVCRVVHGGRDAAVLSPAADIGKIPPPARLGCYEAI
jgi:hypothetical protein